MGEKVLRERVHGPQGEFVVSTIKTFSGGAEDGQPLGSPFRDSDYADENPWPFETMVFKAAQGSDTNYEGPGLYHEPHNSLTQAREGHAYAVSIIRDGTLQIGAGVRGTFGVPSITAEEWRDRIAVKAER